MEEKKLKWLMLTNYIHENLLGNEECLRTGLYSWIPVFDGDIKNWRDVEPEELKKYDIIQVNLSGQDLHLLGEVREVLGKDSKTKLVANNDYTLELWSNSVDYFQTFKREIDHADIIFGTEPHQVGALETLLGRKVHLIVHPCFVKRLKSLSHPRQKDAISVVSHRYDQYNRQPSLAVKGLGPRTRLIGYDENSDSKKYLTSTCYNEIHAGTNYMDFCTQLMESKVVVDPFTFTSQSRTGWDCAALGVPMVGSDRNYSANVCFPYTTCSPYDIKEIRRLTKKLLEDEEFRKKVIDYAKEKVEYVSYESSKKKYLAALEEGSPKIEV
ncbi:MAG: hypothetical protein DRP42_05130 [Tenericutes bacterium]|nr:MAG: hypothetical protein DRP42_05130 [Mycoplasmatota bacterium]